MLCSTETMGMLNLMEIAYLAGGCFWCIEETFHGVYGIYSHRVGYSGKTEAIEIVFDPKSITFLQILDLFWVKIDPLDAEGQFADRGEQYHTAIYPTNDRQQRAAVASKKEVERLLGKEVATAILPLEHFEEAEPHHQSYCIKQPGPFSRYASTHETYLNSLWGPYKKKLYQTLLRDKLTPLQWHVTQERGTEPPFQNSYWNHNVPGFYLDVITREPLFSSEDKYDSGTGWPSFTKPLIQLVEKEDLEVVSPYSNAHLGHVFPDGPPEKGGLRYCMNSAALFFRPL